MRENINSQNELGNTLLHKATNRGDIQAVARLLQMGADVSIKNNAGKTAIDWAVEDGEDEILELLSNAEIDKEVRVRL